MKISRKKIWIIVSAVAVVALIIVAVIVKNTRSVGTRIATEKVILRTIIQTVSSNGKIPPEKDIKTSP